MATFVFDGTANITATKADTVIISADPTTFTQASDNGTNTTLGFGANSITITGTTLGAGNLPNVYVQGGQFNYYDTTNTLGNNTGNYLSFGDTAAITVPTTLASSKVAIFGGLGRVDTNDGADTIHIGGQGTELVFGNSGADSIDQSVGAFDSTSVVNVSGDAGADVISFTSQNTGASIFVGGGADNDMITVVNSGKTTIFGGLDSTDGNDTIAFDGITGGAAGSSVIYGNGGDDSITVGGNVGLDSTSSTTVFGGFGNDTIAATGTKATISILGGEGSDSITVTNSGSTFITGGNQSGDQSLDGADTIAFTGSGNIAIFGNAGNDVITATVGTGTPDTSTVSIYGGLDNDNITQTIANGSGNASVFIAGGQGGDTISAVGNGGGVTIYGGTSSSDSTDGSDSITYGAGSTGKADIFGNAGNDTINIGNLGSDSANTVTVSGGIGNDSIVIAAQNTPTNQQHLVVNGNEGADNFVIAKGVGQSITVGDFTVGAAGDKLAITGATAGALAVVAPANYSSLQGALDAAANTASGAASKSAAVAFGGDAYVVVEGGAAHATFVAATDQAIKLTGVTDLASLAHQTTITA